MTDLILSVTPPLHTTSDGDQSVLIGIIFIIAAILLFLIILAVSIPKSNEKTTSKEDDAKAEKNEPSKEIARKKHPVLTLFLVLLVLVGSFFGITSCVKHFQADTGTSNGTSSGVNKPQIFSRNANNGDINVGDTKLNLGSLGQDFVFLANANIKNLELTLKFYDKGNNLIATKTKFFSSVSKGNEYTFTVALTDFSLSDTFKINRVSIGVTGGTVSLI